MHRCCVILFLLTTLSMGAFSRPSVSFYEAKAIVKCADSLRAVNKMYDDSTQIAQAYETLTRWRWLFADDYLHACYHYGRFLKDDREDFIVAMQCFINGTHSRSRDYEIYGRIYTNIAEICEFAGEYQIAYDMNARSADYFLLNGDSLMFCYSLNFMALEMAELSKKEETLLLLDSIEKQCDDQMLMAYIYVTKAIMYRNVSQYDSAIYFVDQAEKNGYITPLNTTIKAQAFSRLKMADSAIIYSKRVLQNEQSSFHNKFNALYIISHNDSTLTKEQIRDYASQREDIRFYEREPRQDKLIQAVQLLEQDLNRKPDYLWLWSIIGTLLVIGVFISIRIYQGRHKRDLLSQEIDDLKSASTVILKKHNEIEEHYRNQYEQMESDIVRNCATIRNSADLAKNLYWMDFEALCKIVDRRFYMLASKLRKTQALNETEVRLCILVLLDLNRAEIANTLPYALNSVGKLKDHTAKKLGTTGKNLRTFLVRMAIEG